MGRGFADGRHGRPRYEPVGLPRVAGTALHVRQSLNDNDATKASMAFAYDMQGLESPEVATAGRDEEGLSTAQANLTASMLLISDSWSIKYASQAGWGPWPISLSAKTR